MQASDGGGVWWDGYDYADAGDHDDDSADGTGGYRVLDCAVGDEVVGGVVQDLASEGAGLLPEIQTALLLEGIEKAELGGGGVEGADRQGGRGDGGSSGGLAGRGGAAACGGKERGSYGAGGGEEHVTAVERWGWRAGWWAGVEVLHLVGSLAYGGRLYLGAGGLVEETTSKAAALSARELPPIQTEYWVGSMVGLLWRL